MIESGLRMAEIQVLADITRSLPPRGPPPLGVDTPANHVL